MITAILRRIADVMPLINWHVVDAETGRIVSKHKRFGEAQAITDILNGAITE